MEGAHRYSPSGEEIVDLLCARKGTIDEDLGQAIRLRSNQSDTRQRGPLNENAKRTSWCATTARL